MAGKIDFKQVKLIPVASVLAHYRIETRKRDNNELVANCPFASHTSKESKWSLAIGLEKNKWYCHSDSCRAASGMPKGGDVIDLICMLDGHRNLLGAAKKLADIFCLNGNGTAPAPPKPVEKQNAPEPKPNVINPPLGYPLTSVRYDHEYLDSRKLTMETRNHFGVGYFYGKSSWLGDNRIVIPIHNEKGELVANAGRSLNGAEPKYRLPKGFLKSHVVYNLHRIAEQVGTLVIVEGFFSVMWLWQNDVRNAVALMGKTVSDEQMHLLAGFRKLVLMLDGDEPGKEAQKELTLTLAKTHFVYSVTLPDGKQPDQLPKEELDSILSPVLE